MRMFSTAVVVFIGLSGLGLANLASANSVDPVQQHNSNAVWFENWIGLKNATMIVAAPNGRVTTVFAESGTPVYELERGKAMDGVYSFELSAATDEKMELVNPIDNGRESVATSQGKPFHLTGRFVVARGVIISPEDIKEE